MFSTTGWVFHDWNSNMYNIYDNLIVFPNRQQLEQYAKEILDSFVGCENTMKYDYGRSTLISCHGSKTMLTHIDRIAKIRGIRIRDIDISRVRLTEDQYKHLIACKING